ncbi:Sodium channel protein Nach [Atta colombica]|uniref:Sodium channel protein Nach n=1 Tax=Atta colombica TaxID=520822 RepID=A0A195BAV7_9HYME|nr:Sodium channel protein Nach [Atta colombica]
MDETWRRPLRVVMNNPLHLSPTHHRTSKAPGRRLHICGPHKSSNPQITILFCSTKQMRYSLQKREKRKKKCNSIKCWSHVAIRRRQILWIIIHYTFISFLVFMVYISYHEFMTTPLVTSPETDDYKTTLLSFPAIAICSINRISWQSATELATNISKANITNQTVDEILILIMRLGNFYIYDFDTLSLTDNNYDVELDKLLTTYYNGTYDVTEIMKTLTPQCSMMLLKCKLHGKYTNCSTLFKFRKTPDGYCCTFNYVRESDDISEQNDVTELSKSEQVWDLGIERGLTVVMDPFLDDYFYSMLPIKGWKASKDYSWRICNSLDSECLAKHKSDWLTILPHEEEHTNFEKEEKALHCYSCYAACEDISYDVLSWTTDITPGKFNTNLLQNYNVTNEGIVHVYFSKYGTIKLKQDMSFYWYDLVSDIGGICGVFIGFSFITIVELLYFFMLMFRDLFYKKSVLQKDDDRKTEIPSDQTQTTGAIYWNELQPRSWHSAKYGKFFANRVRY